MPQRRPAKPNRQQHGPFGIFIATVVTVVWATSVTVAMKIPNGPFTVSPAIHGVMLAVVGAILGRGWVIQRRNGHDDGQNGG